MSFLSQNSWQFTIWCYATGLFCNCDTPYLSLSHTYRFQLWTFTALKWPAPRWIWFSICALSPCSWRIILKLNLSSLFWTPTPCSRRGSTDRIRFVFGVVDLKFCWMSQFASTELEFYKHYLFSKYFIEKLSFSMRNLKFHWQFQMFHWIL